MDIALMRVPVWQEWLHLDACKLINDEPADMCKRSNGRLYANAVLPPWGGKDNPCVVHHAPLPVHWQGIYEWTDLRREFGRIMDQQTAVGREQGMKKEAMLRLDMRRVSGSPSTSRTTSSST